MSHPLLTWLSSQTLLCPPGPTSHIILQPALHRTTSLKPTLDLTRHHSDRSSCLNKPDKGILWLYFLLPKHPQKNRTQIYNIYVNDILLFTAKTRTKTTCWMDRKTTTCSKTWTWIWVCQLCCLCLRHNNFQTWDNKLIFLALHLSRLGPTCVWRKLKQISRKSYKSWPEQKLKTDGLVNGLV